jgi:hypothetical protein
MEKLVNMHIEHTTVTEHVTRFAALQCWRRLWKADLNLRK